jgi:two-component system alkaline phosphatase synthesis response regulator PhoP
MGNRVLIADDEEGIVELLAMRLADDGIDCKCALDGEEAWSSIVRERPSVVVLDVMMPRLTGWEVAERMRRDPFTASIPVIFVTAGEQPHDQLRGLEMGAYDFLVKPFDLHRIAALIADAAAGRPAQSEAERSDRIAGLRKLALF